MIRFKYRPDIDGLRAIAVLLVVLFHAGLGFAGGFVGVDVFFVISGFLITGLILKDMNSESFSLVDFWVRRIRRIVPAATVMVVLVLVAGYFLLLPDDYAELGQSGVAQQLMMSNFFFWQNTGYFDGPADMKPLLHTWSLSVEEQFYLIYPFLFLTLFRFGAKTMFVVLGTVSIASLGISQYGVMKHPGAAFFFLPTRAWELLLGGLVCFLPPPNRLKQWIQESVSWVCLGTILLTSWFFTSNTPFPGIAAMLPCFSAAMLIYVNSSRLSLPTRILAAKPIVFVGLISYSLYLWHWPVFAFSRYWAGQELSVVASILALVASFAFALASWWFVELPFRASNPALKRRFVFANAGFALAIVVGFSFAIYTFEGIPSRLPKEVVHVMEGQKRHRTDLKITYKDIRNNRLPVLGELPVEDRSPDFLLWGDSHALAVAAGFDDVAINRGKSGVIAVRAGTIPLLETAQPVQKIYSVQTCDWNAEIIRYIRRNKIKNVCLVARWAIYIQGLPNGKTKMCIAEPGTGLNKSSTVSAFENGLKRTLDELEDLDVNVWVFKQVPCQTVSPQKIIVRCKYVGSRVPGGITRAEHNRRQRLANSIIDRQTQNRKNVQVVDLSAPFFNRQGVSVLANWKGSYYGDDNHISDLGARTLIRPLLDTLMLELENNSDMAE